MSSPKHDPKDTLAEFKEAVNMTPAALRKWLQSEESRSVGMTSEGEKVTGQDGGEAVGHRMGERILELKGKKQADLDDDDYAAMRKVIGYVHRHIKQRPSGDVSDTRWRKSLMNWGHDPVKD
ncbi:DUF3140 domain-containing protein [Pseudoroseomonas globiformis]|uniref:DUF3140 domain-containing protein n=1 Tax=Teichococcus globiformis TaxID=2307229 RepID=A0ABV7G077_9PROT